MKKDVTIQFARVIAMFFIIACHIVQEFDNSIINMTSQFFNIGVYMFLIISGYLYSNKKINKKTFYKDRFLKILLPIYIFIIPVFIIQLINGTFLINKVFVYLFNLQGFFGGIQGANHLWFITAIWISYLLLPIFEYIKNSKNQKIQLLFNLCMILFSILMCFLFKSIGMIFICICTYAIGYFYFENVYKVNDSIFKNTFVIVVSFIIRIVAKSILDNSILYDLIIVGITQVIASIYIIKSVKIVVDKKILKTNKVLDLLEKYSYYIYITHYLFMKGNLSVMKLSNNMMINITFMLLLTICSSILLKCTCDYIYRKVGGKYEVK